MKMWLRWPPDMVGKTHVKNRRIYEKDSLPPDGMCLLMTSVAAFAQSGGGMGQHNMKSDDASKKAMSVTGKISDDGKMFTAARFCPDLTRQR
jgi:hypothetical protein